MELIDQTVSGFSIDGPKFFRALKYSIGAFLLAGLAAVFIKSQKHELNGAQRLRIYLTYGFTAYFIWAGYLYYA